MGNFFGDFLDAITGNDHTTEVHDDSSYTGLPIATEQNHTIFPKEP